MVVWINGFAKYADCITELNPAFCCFKWFIEYTLIIYALGHCH